MLLSHIFIFGKNRYGDLFYFEASSFKVVAICNLKLMDKLLNMDAMSGRSNLCDMLNSEEIKNFRGGNGHPGILDNYGEGD